MGFDAALLATPRLALLDIQQLFDPRAAGLQRHVLPLDLKDRRLLTSMLSTHTQDAGIVRHVSCMLHSGFKAEIEALECVGPGVAGVVALKLAQSLEVALANDFE